MFPPRLIIGFLWKFALMYGLLIAPWPGLATGYARWFRAAGNLVFARENDWRLLAFEAVPDATHVLDTRILLANREAVDASGNIPAKYLELDSRAVGWIPTAMIVALMLSTPIVWTRKWVVCLAGISLVQALILFSLAIYIWNNSPSLGLFPLNPWTKRLTEGLQETLITQMGTSFVVPVCIWLLMVFGASDFVVQGLRSSRFVRGQALAKAGENSS